MVVPTIKPSSKYKRGHTMTVVLLNALQVVYLPFDLDADQVHQLESISYCENYAYILSGINRFKAYGRYAQEIEHGRVVARNICEGDPERTSALNIVKYLQQTFKDIQNIKITV